MNTPLEIIIKRAQSYWFADGFTEIIAGVLFIILGGILMLSGFAPQASFIAQFASAALYIALAKFLGILIACLVLWWLKNRFTYPRTGFVRAKWVSVTQMLSFIWNALLIISPFLLGIVALFIFLPPARGLLFSLPGWFPVGLGAIWAGLCIFLGRKLGLRRFQWAGLFILLAGIAVGVWQFGTGLPRFPAETLQANFLNALPQGLHAPLTESLNRTLIGMGALTMLSGLILTISGLVTFLRYRKENPVPYNEEAA